MYSGYLNRLCVQLALEYGCSPSDLTGGVNIITPSALRDGRRVYSHEAPFFQMATLGTGAVITADERLHPFLREYTSDKEGYWLFELSNLMPIERELNRHGRTLTDIFHMFLPERRVQLSSPLPVKWFFGEDILQFYGDSRFPNAICPRFLPERPDRIVVCAYDGGEIAGMAGCSEDAPHWFQIGVDVMEPYRCRGIGSALVSLLTERIIQSGDVPFYGTSSSNYRSWRVALKCGFRPAWVEIGSRSTD